MISCASASLQVIRFTWSDYAQRSEVSCKLDINVMSCADTEQITHSPGNKFQLKSYLTQNMQDRQTQVRAGPARAAGRLRETDGMVTDRSDDAAAAATDQ